ncbi:regulatory protein ArsR [Desulfurispirillum indicum S5]|uniref:Regulatory protein ArsR n=1 Tax=Desulfurispirillum indicum (strain ATCC BAA-1389 / DSM 22839 / S5) TaxID=653733 RepID=E6W701_DESIS|nr:metalloregulator ArsR/SmtB family transcription factor [Desulfurispirillum indicum]ADU65079.1 regulatory protein ArsR [Desulfurispirillum indicum S5]
MHSEQSQNWAAILKALAHPTRLLIAAELLQGTRCVTDMEDILPVSQANISQHLAVLRHAGLVDFAQDGALRCYYLSRPQLVAGFFDLLAQERSPIHKTKEQIQREKELSAEVKE